MERILTLLLLLVVIVNAGPLNLRKPQFCAKTCTVNLETSKLKFRPGRDYAYNYVSEAITSLTTDKKQSSGLQVKGKASFEVISPCEMVLRMKDVTVFELTPDNGNTFTESPRSLDFKYALETHDLHFSYHDGTISDLCPNEKEKTWVLNVKRGIISMMQNTMSSLDEKHEGNEVDITGECKVRYSRSKGTILREKDLLACSGHEHRRSALQSIPYFVRSNTQGAPLTKSTHKCQQTVGSKGHLETIICEEEHRLRTFSGSKGARTEVTQSLYLIGDTDAPPRSHRHAHRRTDLKYEYDTKSTRTGHELTEVREFLREICARSRSDIRPQTPRFFTEIVYRLRRLNEKDLTTIFNLVDNLKTCRTNNAIVRRLVIDAIPILGNPQSMAIMKKLIVEGRVSNIEANLWLTSLAFVQNPTHEMLAYLHPLLNEKQPRRQAMLGLSAMVHQYCKTRPECHAEPAVQAIGRALRRQINGDCSTNTLEEQTQMLLAIKAIGNAGVLSVISPDLVRCVKRAENSMAVRVAAADAFRRMDCSVNRKDLIEIYKNKEIDSELRINSYLAIMTCPTADILNIVKTQLAFEKVNQVGSFVWTHLTNLAETSDPLRKHVKDIVEDISLKREFKLDKLKFSRNVEKSLFFKTLNIGGRMESNVIWSHKSFLPRSVSLNLTSHLFGQSYNFLEFNGRVEGLETMLERYFGPEGYFKQNKTEKKGKGSALSNKDFQFMDNKFKLQNDRLRAGLGFKVFGHEVAFFDIMNTDKKSDNRFNFLDLLIKLAKRQEMEWTKHLMFLDSSITIPTITGLPLELSINGTASLSVSAVGKLDIRRMLSWPSTFEVDGSVKPSGSVEISAMMGVNAFYSRHGLKMVSNVHSSTQLDAKLKAKDSETFEAVFGMPRDKQEVVNFDTKFFVVHRTSEKEHTLPSVRRFNRKFCTGKTMVLATGAELCATVRSPAITSMGDLITVPVFSPFSASVALHKRDTHSGYKVALKWLRKKFRFQPHSSSYIYSRFVRFEVDTPNSRHSRRHLLDFALDFDARAIRLHAESPQRRFGFSGAFTTKYDHKEVTLKFFKDDVTYVNVNVATKILRRGQTLTIIPSLKVMIPGLPFISLRSQVSKRPGQTDFALELKNLLRAPLVVRGSASRSMTEDRTTVLDGRVSMNSHFFVGSVAGTMKRQRGQVVNSLTVKYGPSFTKQHTATLNSNLKLVKQRGNSVVFLTVAHQMSQWPACRSSSAFKVKLARRSINVNTEMIYGLKLGKKISAAFSAKAARSEGSGMLLSSTAFVKIPHMERHHAGKARLTIERDTVTLNVDYKHRPAEKTLKISYRSRIWRKETVQVQYDLAASVMQKHRLMWDAELERVNGQLYRFNTRGDLNGRKMSAEGRLEMPNERQVQVTTTIKTGTNDVIVIKADTRANRRNPKLTWSLTRNNQERYAVSANYDFLGDTPEEFSVEFGSGVEYPQRQMRAAGYFKRKDTDLAAQLTSEWDVERDPSKMMVIEASYSRGEEGAKKTRQFDLSWKHPLRNGHVQMAMEKEDLKGSLHLELQVAPKRQFVIDSMYEIDDGWTQKGLMASITVKTPFKKFERTHLGVNLFGQLRYRKAEIQFSWGNNKRIVTTLVVRPTGGTNFLATLKIVTPFPRYSYMRFHLKNEFSGNQVQSELISEVGTKKTFVKVLGVNNGDYYMNDLAMSVSMTSPFEDFRDLTLTIDHKDDSNQYSSNLQFKWNKEKRITAAANFNYNRNGIDIRTAGEVRYSTPFKGMERGSLNWAHQNTKAMVKSEATLEIGPNQKVELALRGIVTEPDSQSLRISGTTSATISQIGRFSAKLDHTHSSNSVTTILGFGMPSAKRFDVEVRGLKEPKRLQGSVNVNTPFEGYRKIGGLFNMDNKDLLKTIKSEIYAGNTKAALASISGKLTLPSASDPNVAMSASFRSRIIRDIDVSVNHQHTLTKAIFNSISEVTYAPGRSISIVNELGTKPLKFKSQITTPFQVFRTFQIGFDHEGNIRKFRHSHFVIYNDVFELHGGVSFQGVNNMIAESKINYKGFHYLRLSHVKTGSAYDTIGTLTYATSKTIELKSQVATDPSVTVDVSLITPFKVIRKVVAKLSAEGSALKSATNALAIVGSASYNYGDQTITMNGVCNVKDLTDIRTTLEVKTPFDNLRDISVLLQHSKNGKEYITSVIAKSENGRIEVTNLFQKAGTLKNKLTIKSPLSQFKGITFSFEHRGRFPKVSHTHLLSFDIAGVKANLKNKFDIYNLRLIEVESAFRSNVKVIRKAGFRVTFDKPISGIETGILVEWPQDKLEGRIAFKSKPDKKLQLKISTPFYYFKELQGLYTLRNKGSKNFKHQVILAFKNEPLSIGIENSLIVKTLNYIDAQLKINTPIDAFKTFDVSYHHEMLKRSKTFEAKGMLNDKKYSLKGTYTSLPIHVVDLSIETPHKSYKAINLRNELSLKDNNNWKVTSEYFNNDLNDRIVFNADFNKEPTKLESRHSVSRNGKVVHEVSLKTAWENEKMFTGTVLIMNKLMPKNAKVGQMIMIETTADVRKAINLRASMRTPYKKIENQWFTLKFERNEFLKADTMKTGNLVVKGNLFSKTAALQIRYSYGKRPSFQMNLKLPNLQEMKLEGSLVMSQSNSLLKASLTMPDHLQRPWSVMVDVINSGTIAVTLKLDTTIKKYETITARASITKRTKYAKVSGRLTMPVIKKPIEFDLEGDLNNGLILSANMRGPVVRYFKSKIRFVGDRKRFDSSAEIFTNYLKVPMTATLKFNSANGFKVEGSIRSPFDKLKRLELETAVIISEKRGYVELYHNMLKKSIRAEGKVDYSKTKFDGNFFVRTPFKGAENTELNFAYEKKGYQVKSKFDISNSAMKGRISGNLDFTYEKPKAELTATLETPFEQMKQTSISAVLLVQRDVNGRFSINHNKLPGAIKGRIDLKFPKSIELELTTPYETWYKNIQFSSTFTMDKSYKATGSLKYYPANVISANFEAAVELPKIYVTYNIATPFKVMRQTYGTMKIKAVKNFEFQAEAYHNKMDEKITLSARLDDAETKTLRIQLNTPFNGPWKDIGVKLYFTRKPGAFKILKTISVPVTFSVGARISYHPNKRITWSVSMDWASLKKFNANMQLKTPFEVMKKATMTVKFDLDPKILIVAELAHNKYTEGLSYRLFVDPKSKKFFMKLSTPLKGPFRLILIDGFSKLAGTKHQFEVHAEYFEGKKFTLTGDVLPDFKDFSLNFKLLTPFDVMKETSGKLTFNPKAKPMVRFEIFHNKLPGKIEGRLHVKPFRRLKFILKTPFDGAFKDILLDYSVKKTVKGETASLTLKYSPAKVMRGTLMFEKSKTDIKSVLEIETPFKYMKKFRSSLMANWKDKITSEFKTSHNMLKNSIRVELNYEKKESTLVQVSLTTPFDKLKSLDTKLTYLLKGTTRKAGLTSTYNKAKTLELHGSLTLDKNSKDVSLGIKTPFKGIWKDIAFNAHYTKMSGKHSLVMKLIYDMTKTIEVMVTTTTDVKNIVTTYLIKTPFEVMSLSQGKLTFNMVSKKSFKGSLTFLHPKLMDGKTLEVKAEGKLNPSDKNLQVEVTYKGKTYTGKVYHKQTGKRYESGVSVVTDKPDRPWLMHIEINAPSIENWNLKARMTSPSHRLNTGSPGFFKVFAEHKGNRKNFENAFEVTSPYKKDVKYTGSFSKKDMKAQFTLDLPFEKVKQIKFIHVGSYKKFKTMALIDLKKKSPIEFTTNAVLSLDNIDAEVKLMTPFDSWKENSLKILHQVSPVRALSSKYSKSELEATSTVLGTLKVINEMRISSLGFQNTFDLKSNLKKTKLPKSLKVTVKTSPMTSKETSSEIMVESSALKEKMEMNFGWKKSVDSFRGNLKLNAIKKILKSELVLDISKMKAEETTAYFTAKSDALKEPVKISVDWKKTGSSFQGTIESKIPVKYMKSKVSIIMPKMKPSESDVAITLTSSDIKEPVKVNMNWRKTDSSFQGLIESQIPVKYMKSSIIVNIPKMKSTESEASITLASTDLKKPIKVNVNWKKGATSFVCTGSVQAPIKYMTSQIVVKADPVTKTNFNSELTVESTDLKDKISAKLSWRKAPKALKASVSLKTPFDTVKEVETSFSYAYGKERFIGDLKMTANKLGSINSDVNWELRGETRANIVINKRSGSGRYKRSSNKIFALTIKGNRREMTTTIELPTCKKVKLIVIESKHLDKSSKTTVTWDSNKVSFTLNRPEKTRTLATIETTFEKFKRMDVEVKASDKCCDDVEYFLKVTLPKGSTSTKLSWKKSNGLTALGEIENNLIPKVPNMSFKIIHRGTNIRKFDNTINLKFADKKYQMISKFNIMDKKEGSVEIITPHKKFEKNKASFLLTSEKPKISLVTEVKTGFGYGAIEIVSVNEGKPTDRNTGTITLKLNKKVYEMELKYEGEPKNFKAGLRLNEKTSRVRRATTAPWVDVQVSSRLDSSSYTGSISLLSKYLPEDYQKVDVKVKTAGDFKKFKKFSLETSATTKKDTYLMEMKWDFMTIKSATISVRFPSLKKGCVYSGDAKISIGSDMKITSNAFKCKDKLFSFEMESDLENKMTASLKTPMKMLNTDVTYEHNFLSKAVSSSLTVKNAKFGEYTGKFSTSWSKEVLAEAQLIMPKGKTIELKIRQSGVPKKMTIDVSLTLPDKRVIKTELSYSVEKTISVKLNLETPLEVLKKLEIDFSHKTEINKFLTVLELKHNQLGQYSSSLSFDSSRSVFIIFTLNTPHKQLKKLQMNFSYLGKITQKFEQTLFVIWNDKKIGYSAAINVPKLLYRIEIDTPFKGYEKIIISNEHNGKADKFSHAIKVDLGNSKVIRFDVSHHKRSDGYNGALRFRSHFKKLKDVRLELNHQRVGPKRWMMNHKLTYAPKKVIQAEGTLSHGLPKVSAILTITTPFEPVKDIKIKINHNHQKATNFDFNHELKVNDKSGSLRGSLKVVKDVVTGQLFLQTPFKRAKHFDLNFIHNGGLRKFENSASVTYAVGRRIAATTKFDITKKDTVAGSLKLSTPFPEMSTGEIVLKHTGTLRRHYHSLTIGVNDKKIAYHGMMSVANPMDMGTEHTLKTPFPQLESLKVQFDHKNGLAHLNLHWNKGNYVKVVGLVNTKNIILAELTVTTSFKQMANSYIRLKHAGPSDDFSSQGVVNINGEQSDIKLRFRRNLPEVTVVASFPKGHPHNPVYLFNIGFEKVKDELKGKLKVSKDKTVLLQLTTSVDFKFSTTQKTLDIKAVGILPVSGENKVKIEFSFNGNKNQFMALAKGKFFKKHVVQTMLTFNTYNKMELSGSYNKRKFSIGYIFGDSADMPKGKNLSLKLAVDKYQGAIFVDISRDALKIDVRTPFKAATEIYLFISHKQKSRIDFIHRSVFRLNRHRYFNLDLTVDTKKGVIVMKAPTKVSIKYSLAGTRYIRAEMTVDPDRTNPRKKLQFQVFMQLDKDASKNTLNTEGYISMKSEYRVFVLETKTSIAKSSFFHKTTLKPKGSRSKPWSIYISILRHIAGHDRQRTDEWILSTPVREMKIHMETVVEKDKFSNDLNFYWDNGRVTTKKMGWNLRAKRSGKEYSGKITFHHPIVRDGVSLDTLTVLRSDDSIIKSRATIKYSDKKSEAIDIALKISRPAPKMLRGSFSIRQEATQLNTKLSGSFGGHGGVYINGLTLAHMMNNKVRTFQVLSHINVLKRSVMLEVVTPIRTYSWMSVAYISTKDVKINYQLSYDKNKKVMGDLVISRNPSFKTRLYFTPGNTDNYVEARGLFLDKKHLEIQIHRMAANRRYTDFLFSLKLRGEHLLKSRIFWRPSLMTDARQYVMGRISDAEDAVKVLWPQFVRTVRREWSLKKNLIIATIPNFDALRRYSNNEVYLIKEDLFKLGGMLYDSFMSNEFYLYDLSKFLIRYAAAAEKKARVMRVSLERTLLEQFLPRLQIHINGARIMAPMRRTVGNLVVQVRRMTRVVASNMDGVSQAGRRHISQAVEALTPVVKSMHQRYAQVESKAAACATAAYGSVHRQYRRLVHPHVTSVRLWAANALRGLAAYHRDSRSSIVSHFHQDLQKAMTRAHVRIQSSIDALSHHYGQMFSTLRTRMNRQLNSSLDLSQARFASSFIRAGIKKIQWAYDHFDLEQKLKDFGHMQYLQALEYLRENSIDVIKDYLRLEQNRLTVFEPSRGRIEGQIYLPFLMHDLISRPDFSNFARVTRKISRACRRLSEKPLRLPSLREMKNSVLKYIPNLEKNPRAWMPSFRGYASIAGKHIITFDKVHFDLDGNCDYVLARDYKAARWTVLLNQASSRPHVSIRAYGRVFAIHKDNRVLVDGTPVELPFVYRNLTILRFGPIIKAKDSVLGFSVTSDVVNDLHTLGVTGWYHGKLGGLFGNFDNEQFNDMQTPDHRLVDSADTFIQSWAIRGCQHNNRVSAQHHRPSGLAKRACNFLFANPLSPLAKCFRHVDAKPFLAACTGDFDSLTKDGPKARICHTARLYVYHCRKSHVRVRLPRPCRQCPVPGGENIKEDKFTTLENSQATADVVFVVEEAPCNREVVPRLNDIVRRLELAFRRRGLTNNRYGLVGYGRRVHGMRCSRGHSHTVDSQLMGSAGRFQRALSNFDLDTDPQVGQRTDPLRAIRKAARYPLRPGSARHVIVVPCTACDESRLSVGEVEDALKDQDVLVSVLLDHNLRLRRPNMSPQSSYLFGVDRRTVYTQRDVEALRGDARLFRRVVRPQDMCSQLAYNTGGAVFNSRKLTRMHVSSQSWFAQVFANRLAHTSQSPRNLECTCSFSWWDRPLLMCKKIGHSTVQVKPPSGSPMIQPLALPPRSSADRKLQFVR